MNKKDKFILFEAISFMLVLVLVSLFVGFYLARVIDDYQLRELAFIGLKVLAIVSILVFSSASLLRKGYEQGLKANETKEERK